MWSPSVSPVVPVARETVARAARVTAAKVVVPAVKETVVPATRVATSPVDLALKETTRTRAVSPTPSKKV